jgi:Predicted dehydrogenases and related proteins
MSKVKVGIIGLGFIGKIHLEKLAENPYVKISGISDIDENQIEVAKDLLSKIGIRNEIESSTNFERILDEVDAVFIASPAKTHYEILKKAIEKGKHVFVEKPLCTRYDQAEEIKYIAEKKRGSNTSWTC